MTDHPKDKPLVTRRDFLKLLRNGFITLSGLLGLGGLVRYLFYQPEPPPPVEYDLGPASNYPMDSRTALAHIPAIIIHDKKGFTALSLVCTHLGCTVDVKYLLFECPCHGSKYDADGQVLKGPSTIPLTALRIEETPDGNLRLYVK